MPSPIASATKKNTEAYQKCAKERTKFGRILTKVVYGRIKSQTCMRRLALMLPHPFPLCADCVQKERAVSAALLVRKKNCGGEGSNRVKTFIPII
jgi:hypothetical protein